MIDRIFPRQIDNTYRGHWVGLALLAVYALLKLVMSVNSIVNTRSVATGADGLALDSYGAGGADAVLLLFAIVAVGQLLMTLLTVIVLVRYRAMVPLMYLLLLADHIGRRLIVALSPIERTTASSVGFYINLALLALLLVGFTLSLVSKSRPTEPPFAEGSG